MIFSKYKIDDKLPWGTTTADELLKPTRIYVKHFKALKDAGIQINGIAHITGSGFKKVLRLGKWKFHLKEFPEIPDLFNLIRYIGDITWLDMFTTFNMGIGLVLIVSDEDKEKAFEILNKLDKTYMLGIVEDSKEGLVVIDPHEVTID